MSDTHGTCPDCDLPLAPNARYCDSCGAEVSRSAWAAVQAITDNPEDDGELAIADECDRILEAIRSK